MNSKNSKTSIPHDFILKFTDKLDLRRGKNTIALSYNNNKFKISAPTWNDKFELPDGLYSVSDIQDYFWVYFKKHGESTDNPSVRIYVNKIENRGTLKIKAG